MRFIFFYVLILVVLSLAGTYIYFRTRPLLPSSGIWQIISRIVFVLTLISFIIGFILQSRGYYLLSTPFTIIGSWVLAAILYFVLFFLVIDILRLINLPLKLDFLSFKYTVEDSKGKIYSMIVSILTALILIIGYFNAKFPITKNLKYQTKKEIQKNFKYILVSDVHLGMINGDNFFERLKNKINAENPDFVVIAGDFFDGDPYPVIHSKVGEILEQIKTGCGIYIITGNHEYIGNADTASEFLKQHGVVVLRDSVAHLPFGVSIVGREDLSKNRISPRKPLKDLLQQVPNGNYSIVLDHQPPRHYEEEQNLGIDIELSGHTHAGAQLWPLFLITKKIYENDFGEITKNGSIFYTTSGYGTWGPPIRTSARPEMVVIEVTRK